MINTFLNIVVQKFIYQFNVGLRIYIHEMSKLMIQKFNFEISINLQISENMEDSNLNVVNINKGSFKY